jgi:hypothetical protein
MHVNTNVTLVASFSPDEPLRAIDYRSELEQIEREREDRSLRQLMSQRSGPCG